MGRFQRILALNRIEDLDPFNLAPAATMPNPGSHAWVRIRGTSV